MAANHRVQLWLHTKQEHMYQSSLKEVRVMEEYDLLRIHIVLNWYRVFANSPSPMTIQTLWSFKK